MDKAMLLGSLAEKRLTRAFPESKPSVDVMIDEGKMYLDLCMMQNLSRGEILEVLKGVFKKELFKDYEYHVRVMCVFQVN